jgi:glucosylceramidase
VNRISILTLLCVAFFVSNCKKSGADQSTTNGATIESWLTLADQSVLFQQQPEKLSFAEGSNDLATITVNPDQKFQSIDGFGMALTGGSASLINQKLNAAQRTALLTELFKNDGNNIGISYLRISIGASDLSSAPFTYDDTITPDTALLKFSIAPEKTDLIPVLKEIIQLNPQLQIMGSPWSAPVWMKTTPSFRGGALNPAYYGAYARYLVRYVQEMAKEGIPIAAITPQNEPENPNNTPSLVMTAEEQKVFVKNHLGPAFEKAGLKTKIVIFDHNCDHPNYPISILDDPAAKKYINGTAFHMYLGDISAMSTVHNAHPDRDVYFTEQWVSAKGEFGGDLGWHTKNLIIGATRNWAKTVLEWNLAADEHQNPHTEGGCTECLGAITINGSAVKRNTAYYIIAHASKFVVPQSVRIGSNEEKGLSNVAFLTPEGKTVLIVLNDSGAEKRFNIRIGSKMAQATLKNGAVGTYVW